MGDINRIPNKIIERSMYIERIRPFMRKGIVKVLTGHRRVGKSYVMYQLIQIIRREEPDANIVYINMEDLTYDHLRTYDRLHDYVSQHLKNDGRNYIFIDEIQEVAEFWRAVRSWALNELNDIYITGSNSQMMGADVAGMLSGRYVEIRIWSLTYSEFLTFHHLEDSDETLNLYMYYGGMPYLAHLPKDDDVVTEYLRSIYATIVLRDVVQRKGIRSSDLLERMIRFLADNVGSLFSAKSVSDFLKSQQVKLAPNQVHDYADALAEAYVVSQVRRYDVVGKRLFERGEKYYFENLGICNVVAGYRWQDRAKRLENVVYNHLAAIGYDIKVGTMGKEEIDFVCQRGGETLYVQVALELSREETVAREFGNLLRIRDNYRKVVVSTDHWCGASYEGVEHVHVRELLMWK